MCVCVCEWEGVCVCVRVGGCVCVCVCERGCVQNRILSFSTFNLSMQFLMIER